MSAKAKIKIIKKGEANKGEASVNVEKAAQASKQQAAREMVSTVSNWVSDFQRQRRFETKQAIEKFLSNTPQTN